ncbi:hypothetical protein CEXT_264591 [Caerostris extrusa]|uniref:Uncharacterized protein n=1 Tax=Caerostris extrusa TaxID=172846 RepID=A0AAV4XXG7_CAEEX|nr:hypothetical protein CEXT_264591 [Caerostris extrusa]
MPKHELKRALVSDCSDLVISRAYLLRVGIGKASKLSRWRGSVIDQEKEQQTRTSCRYMNSALICPESPHHASLTNLKVSHSRIQFYTTTPLQYIFTDKKDFCDVKSKTHMQLKMIFDNRLIFVHTYSDVNSSQVKCVGLVC